MKKVAINTSQILSLCVAVGFCFVSCEYREFADAEFPNQIIYMPAANYNNYMIDAVPEARGSSPTPGYIERFHVDAQNGKFNVLLGVYRAGMYPVGSFSVNIRVNNEITHLLPGGIMFLPADKYSLVPSVVMKDGERLAKFDLEVDLDFLLENYPDNKYAIGIEISSADREVNPKLAMTVVVIDTKIMKPTAGFTSSVSVADSKTINFTNTSKHGMSYLWEFGDGSAKSGSKSTSHTYSTAGIYTVTLTTAGITGQEHKSIFSTQVVVE
jgi:hypothetical protein